MISTVASPRRACVGNIRMTRITISYRRSDSGVIAGRIFDRLVAHYGRNSIFRDIDSIPPGVDFRLHIDRVLSQSDIVLALIGPRWIGTRAGQSRLNDEADPVRVEIETALRKGVPLIPVLVLRASMPQVVQLPDSLRDLAYRNAVHVDADQDFDAHMSRLIRAMDGLLRPSDEIPAAPVADTAAEPKPARQRLQHRAAIGAAVAALVTGAATTGWYILADRLNPKSREGAPAVAATSPPAATRAPSPPPALPAAPPAVDGEMLFWQTIATSSAPSGFEEYLSKYPQGRFAGLARNRLALLRPPPGAPPAPEAPRPATPPPQPELAAPARPFSEQSAAVQYPGFRTATPPPPSSPAEVRQEIGRFTAEFNRMRQDRRNTAETGQLLKLFSDSVDRI